MVTIEALACGKPIAGNAVGVLPKLVEEKQPGAYLLPKLINEDIFRFLIIVLRIQTNSVLKKFTNKP